MLHRSGAGAAAVAALVLGAALRTWFWAATPWDWLAHDAAGHLEYVRWMAERWRLPAIGQGWQTYQPPLYYAVTAAMGLVTPRALQDFGLAVSVLTLAVGLGVLHLAIPSRLRAGAPAAFLFLAVHPSLILAAPRVNNDGLSTLLAFTAVLFGLRWWRGGAAGDWGLASAAAGLALLTKNVGFLLPPVLGLLLVLRPAEGWRSRLRLGLTAMAVVAVLSGWLLVHRFGEEAQRDLVANVGGLSQSLRVEVTGATLLGFDPVRVVRGPYVNPFVAGEYRDRVSEYALRSSLFGEYTLARVPEGVARALVVLALAVVFLAAWGAAGELRRGWEDAAPLAAVAAVGVAALLAYLPAAPYATSMDFRYVTLLLLPGAGFLAAAPVGRVRDGVVALFSALAVALVAFLAVGGT
jgi:hypothetical protein